MHQLSFHEQLMTGDVYGQTYQSSLFTHLSVELCVGHVALDEVIQGPLDAVQHDVQLSSAGVSITELHQSPRQR